MMYYSAVVHAYSLRQCRVSILIHEVWFERDKFSRNAVFPIYFLTKMFWNV